MKPKASFVIPAYNADAYLAQAILSCRGQSVKDIEIIIVDDGSTDGTAEVANWHAAHDKRVKLIQIERSGRSFARNTGNAAALAPFIFVLDADDIANKNRVRDTLITFQMKNPDLVYGPFDVIDEHDTLIGKQGAGPWNREMAIKKRQNFIGHSTMAYRKGVTTNVQYDTGEYSDLGLDDWKFQWDCVEKGYKLEVCNQVLSRYRIYRLPNQTYGSPTEFFRKSEDVKRVKDAYINGIETRVKTKV